jgi:PAS domain S-box-containing protein
MPKQTKEELLLEIEDLRIRADEAEETLRAIRKGDVDALVMSGPEGEQVFTLRGAEHPYRVFVEKMNEGALTLTSTGIISFCNARFSTIIQMPQERIVGSSIYDWVPQENRDLFREVFETGREGGGKGEFCLNTATGRLVPVQISTSPLHLGSVTVVCAVVMDITERKATEEKIRSYMDTLEKRNEELQNFAFIASHDLQEPLRKIQVFGDLLAQKSMVFADDQSSDYIDRMRQAATRMRVLLDSLLEYSRVTTKGKSFQRFPLSEAVHEAMSNLEIRIKETKTSIALEDLPAITGDRLQMTMLFQNLIGNAVKFQFPDKEPHVRIYSGFAENGRSDRGVEIHVEDNGTGFDERYSDRIFQPFERLVGRTEYEGVGMGLAICQKIVERHGGSISAKSAPGKGSIFTIKLPVGGEDEEKAEHA